MDLPKKKEHPCGRSARFKQLFSISL